MLLFLNYQSYAIPIVMGSNPAQVACEVFSTDTLKALSIQCYTHVGVGQN